MKKISIAILCGLILFAGCNETKKTTTIRPTPATADLYRLKPKAIDIVHAALADKDGLIKTHAIEIVTTTNRKEMMSSVIQLLKDKYIAVRFAAAVAIGDMKYTSGAIAVKRLLDDENENARIAAAYALTKLKKGDYIEAIKKSLMNRNQTIRANAALLLGKLGDKNALPALYWTLQDAKSGDMAKFQTAEAIAMLGDEKIYQRLWTLLISQFVDDRIVGIRAMGYLNTEKAKDTIITMLDDEVPLVRLCAAEQLGRMGDNTGQVEVIEYLTKKVRIVDPDPEVMAAMAALTARADSMAEMAIGQIGTPELTKYLPKLIQSRSKNTRLRAAQAILMVTK